MLKIGDFSKLSKATVKTLRYYEKEGLLAPAFVDINGYRYYETAQLVDLAKIVSLRQAGCSIAQIKQILDGADGIKVLRQRRSDIENELGELENQLSKINYLLEGKCMQYEFVTKELPEYTVYYKDGIVKDFSAITAFILESAGECMELNPDIKCVEPDYCYVSYLNNEFREEDIKIRYAQAVLKEGVASETIKFMKLKPVKAVCVYHRGSYENLPQAYAGVMKYIEENGFKIIESPRERYIDGMWNKESEEEWLTEIQVPVA